MNEVDAGWGEGLGFGFRVGLFKPSSFKPFATNPPLPQGGGLFKAKEANKLDPERDRRRLRRRQDPANHSTCDSVPTNGTPNDASGSRSP